MEDSSFTKLLEEYTRGMNLHATYRLIPDKGSKRVRSVFWEVSVSDKTVLGVGRSNREAKENAAEIMYNNLIQEKHAKSQVDAKNPIEDLNILCGKLNLATPNFEVKRGTASSHDTTCSVSCSVSSLKEEVKSLRKERAMKQVAHKMLMKLKNLEIVHDQYFSLAEEAKKNASHLTAEGEIEQKERNRIITIVWRERFVKFVQRSATAQKLKKKSLCELDEITDLENLFKRIIIEMDVPYDLSFDFVNDEWVCNVEIFPLHFKISERDKDKRIAGRKSVKRVLECIHFF